MLPILLALGTAAMSAKQAQDQKQSARLAGDRDALQSGLQSAYSGLTGAGVGKPFSYEAGPSVLGQGLAGGIAGAAQGQSFQNAAAQNAYMQLLNKQMAQGGEQPGLPQGGQAAQPTAYSGSMMLARGKMGMPQREMSY